MEFTIMTQTFMVSFNVVEYRLLYREVDDR